MHRNVCTLSILYSYTGRVLLLLGSREHKYPTATCCSSGVLGICQFQLTLRLLRLKKHPVVTIQRMRYYCTSQFGNIAWTGYGRATSNTHCGNSLVKNHVWEIGRQFCLYKGHRDVISRPLYGIASADPQTKPKYIAYQC